MSVASGLAVTGTLVDVTDFIEAQGNVFVAHRLRRVSDRMVEQIGGMLTAMGLDVPPRGASMLLLIDARESIGVVEIARHLRLSHPLIVRMAQRFEELGLVTILAHPDDARRQMLRRRRGISCPGSIPSSSRSASSSR